MNDPDEPDTDAPGSPGPCDAGALFLDRARALLDGRLAPADADALRREIDLDPALREEFDRLAGVFAMTAAEPECAAPALTADDVLARAPSSGRVLRVRRWGVAAAAVLAAAALGVAASFVLAPDAPRDLALAALDAVPPFALRASVPAASASALPARLADYRPVVDGKPAWLTSYDEAAALARETGKPMLVWISHPQCPLCIQLDRKTFADAGVQGDVEAFVPVRVNVMEMEQDSDLGRRLEKSGAWPYIAVIDADGKTLAELPGMWELDRVRPKLDAAAKTAAESPRPTWDQVRTAATELTRAADAERAGRLGEALVAGLRAEAALPAAARTDLLERAQGVRALADRAQRALEDAARAADPASSLVSLDAAAAAFAGSPEGADLAAVARAIRETGRFPRLHDRTETHR